MAGAERRVLMVVHAHPDDESIGTGGILAHYSALGSRTVVVACTLGDCGEISDPAFATPENLADVRSAELASAANILGISRTVHLGYRDSGMDGRPTNDDPRSFHQAPLDEAAGRLVRLVREERPDVIVTYDATGTYGHPDHIKAHRTTVAAFTAAGDWRAYPDTGEPWSPSKLYFTGATRATFTRLAQAMADAGIESPYGRGGGPNLAERIERFAIPDERVTTVVDISPYADMKRAALLAHRTQFGTQSVFARLPPAALRAIWATESFVRVVGPGPRRERDLFEGLA
ncbi:MAG: hypothetical protein EPO26_00045 [Chloroflexota bacterium]|nr:MAG: hypothetical protein EPO26_00045 [Chloroflexota bacterium]